VLEEHVIALELYGKGATFNAAADGTRHRRAGQRR